jgi:translation initiation factor IF-2
MRQMGSGPAPRPGSSGPGGGTPGTNKPRPTPNVQPPPQRRPVGSGQLATPPTPNIRTESKKVDTQKPTGARRIAHIPGDLQVPPGSTGDSLLQRLLQKQREQKQTTTPQEGAPGAEVEVEGEEGEEGKKRGKGGGSGVVGRDQRHKNRQKRRQESDTDVRPGRIGVLVDDEPRRKTLHRIQRKIRPPGTIAPTGPTVIELPITVRSLSAALSMKVNELMTKLMAQGVPNLNINSVLDPTLAELLAAEKGVDLKIKKDLDAEEQASEELKKADSPEDLEPRAPVVVIMGHVDHGKTSLLDRIRQSNVAATEAGGITQVLRAWRVEHNGKPITFLDTPGHEAFTKMRARGANVTDIAVIVVAADDGVMPQTEEAISHAKAAGVSIVVAINKIDVPNANLRKTEQQLYGMGLIPDTMGGDVPFVQTSAKTGAGIDELLENISVVAELKELKANPKRPAQGTCLEAYLDPDEGVFATVLVQNGSLHKGDVVVCGAAFGRVRNMYSDLGRSIQEAGPSVPVRITGLDEVPNADDPFFVVDDLTTAREIAEKRKTKAQEASVTPRVPLDLAQLGQAKIPELKIILKAEARGSIEAIKAELAKLHHEEVRLRVLHAAIGGITESDVQLALTSPEDTIILGFNVVPDDRALTLAEDRGVQIKQYKIIYELTDDLRSALEGKLKPREEVVHLGRAVVRQVFKISKVGTVAGCYVTKGSIERNAKVRVIRNGAVVYPPADRSVGLESLKRIRDDVREVQEGFECGMKIAGYDDIKVDDVIEAYRIEQVQRTLEK